MGYNENVIIKSGKAIFIPISEGLFYWKTNLDII